MPQQSAMSLTGCKAVAAALKTVLAGCVVKLFQSSFHPTPQNVQADFAAAEADFDGYSPVTITTMGDIVLASGNAGYAIVGGLCQYLWSHVASDVQNNIGGWWIEDSGGALYNYFEFATPIPMQGPDQSVVFVPVVPVLTGQTSG